MKILASLLITILGSLAFAGTSSNLTVSAIPQNPVMIPYGTTTVGGTPITAPYFLVNSAHLVWTGSDSLLIAGILLTSHDSSVQVTCALAGDELASAFATNVANGNVILSGTSTVNSGIVKCMGMTLPSPLPNKFAIPVTMTVLGVSIDSNGNPLELVEAQTELVVQ